MVRQTKSVLDALSDMASSMTKKQLILSRYISSEYEKAAFMNSKELARNAGVSESTVLRLAGALGYEKFNDFQSALQDVIRRRISWLDTLESSNSPSSGLLEKIAVLEISLIREMLGAIDQSHFRQAIERLGSAASVLVVGLGDDRGFCEYATAALELIRPDVHEIEGREDGKLTNALAHIEDGVALVYNFPRYYRKAIRYAEYIHDMGVPIIAVTDNRLAPIVPFADIVLLVPTHHQSIVDSRSAVHTLTHALTVGVIKSNPQRARQGILNFYRISNFVDSNVEQDIEIEMDASL